MTAPGTVQTINNPDGSVTTITYSNNADGNGQAIGFTVALTPAPGSALANQQTVTANVAAALAQLRAIQTQAATFQAQQPYPAATLANLNDLLTKTQTIAAAVATIAADLVGVARILANNYDGTT